MSGEKRREHLIDAVRGAAVLSMVVFHFCYDVFIVLGRDPGWYERRPVFLWQQSICWTFLLVSGYVWRWGRRGAWKRGLLLNLCGVLVTAVTLLTVPEETVWFGVLTFLGCATLLLIPLEKPLDRLPPLAGFLLSALLFAVFRPLAAGRIGLGPLCFTVPAAWYTPLLTPLGLPYPGFRSGDYFPLLPWFFLYLAGFYLAPLLRGISVWRELAVKRIEPLGWIGRRSLWIYLLHQPLCMGLAWVLFR